MLESLELKIHTRWARKQIESKFDVDLTGYDLIDVEFIRINGDDCAVSTWDNGVELKKYGLIFNDQFCD